ncbi:hypothetical protein QBC33DRAFT_532522 [Phialemonium atrogriseum]|uniref:Uncharacterized protein n=1 Tax=Phialemonium atrogriseum TaxID=1093897 RepID=A0AAJ0C5M8_9PEZI|nr:uncharacterized protein QBC33DRAFT_532522 [Phialemonium atrogriseum]KAK1769177.1 hypothetical protein QBC33DRAFT_532522 [Phialemonium atrogriseum]
MFWRSIYLPHWALVGPSRSWVCTPLESPNGGTVYATSLRLIWCRPCTTSQGPPANCLGISSDPKDNPSGRNILTPDPSLPPRSRGFLVLSPFPIAVSSHPTRRLCPAIRLTRYRPGSHNHF